MSSRLLLISDLHLEESRPDITAAFLDFLETNAGHCDALYILGDLFEVWIGDDEDSPLIQAVSDALAAFSAAGSAIYLLHGNRDFLIGEEFARRCGASLIAEPTIIHTDAGPLLLLHGDVLCTDDVEYLKFRGTVRQEAWQRDFLGKSLSERREFARQLRLQSQSATANKAEAIMDVNQEAVRRLFAEQGQTTMIHGHTHRPAVHDISFDTPIDGLHQGRRFVLGDWDEQVWFVEVNDGAVSLQNRPLQG